MSIHFAKARLFLLLLAAGCASAPEAVYDPELEAAAARRKQEEQRNIERQREKPAVMLTFDKLLYSFAGAEMSDNFERAQKSAERTRRFLHSETQKHFDMLLEAADNAEDPHWRTIAVAAIGFSRQPEALQPLLNALDPKDTKLTVNALLGLGVLADQRTPLQRIAALMEDDSLPVKLRVGASWALMQIEEAAPDKKPAAEIWLRVLEQPTNLIDPGIVVHAVRGIGLTRDASYASRVEPFVSHATPLVRAAAAIALGRLGQRSSHQSLLPLIGPAETNPNVRLCARKALQALAGDVDRGYDVGQWRQVFKDS